MMTYTSRKEAKDNMIGDQKIVKVCGGYVLMDWSDYYTWKDQK